MNTGTVVVDSSVFVAIFKGEADAARLAERALSYQRRIMSAATWLESAMVCEGASGQGGRDRFERIVALFDVEVVPFSPEQARLALGAFKRFGRGRRAKAALNYGDCCVYALAKELDVPLLFKGNDFAQTDIEPA